MAEGCVYSVVSYPVSATCQNDIDACCSFFQLDYDHIGRRTRSSQNASPFLTRFNMPSKEGLPHEIALETWDSTALIGYTRIALVGAIQRLYRV